MGEYSSEEEKFLINLWLKNRFNYQRQYGIVPKLFFGLSGVMVALIGILLKGGLSLPETAAVLIIGVLTLYFGRLSRKISHDLNSLIQEFDKRYKNALFDMFPELEEDYPEENFDLDTPSSNRFISELPEFNVPWERITTVITLALLLLIAAGILFNVTATPLKETYHQVSIDAEGSIDSITSTHVQYEYGGTPIMTVLPASLIRSTPLLSDGERTFFASFRGIKIEDGTNATINISVNQPLKLIKKNSSEACNLTIKNTVFHIHKYDTDSDYCWAQADFSINAPTEPKGNFILYTRNEPLEHKMLELEIDPRYYTCSFDCGHLYNPENDSLETFATGEDISILYDGNSDISAFNTHVEAGRARTVRFEIYLILISVFLAYRLEQYLDFLQNTPLKK